MFPDLALADVIGVVAGALLSAHADNFEGVLVVLVVFI